MSDKQEKPSSENLIHLTKNQVVSAAPELNARLAEIEKELKHLNAREAATNKSFLELAAEQRKFTSGQKDALDATQNKITSINETYKKLSQDYQRLAAGANLLQAKFTRSQEELHEKIDAVDVAATSQLRELNESHLKVVERLGRIEERAGQLARDMESRFAIMQTTLQALENRLLNEIQEMATQSEQRDDALGIRADRIEEEVGQQVVRLDQRITENTAEIKDQIQQQQDDTEALQAEVDAVNLRLTDSVNDLNQTTEDLSFQASILETRTTELEDNAEQVDGVLAKQHSSLAALGETMQRHYKGFALALVMLAVSLVVVTYQAQSERVDNQIVMQSNLDNAIATQAGDINALKQQSNALQQANAQLTEAITGGDKDLNQTLEGQKNEIAKLRESVEQMEAENANTASRLTAVMPIRSFGLDNVIHNEKWLSKQSADQYVISVMSAETKQDLYDAATRWASLLDDAHLSMLQSGDRFIMYYGPFETQAEAEKVSLYLPISNRYNRPQALPISDVLK